MAAFTLPKSARLRSRADYVATREEGRNFADGPLAASFRRRAGGPTRLGAPGAIARVGLTRLGAPGAIARVGLTVSSKVGGAVTRNRIKRRLREAVRLELGNLPSVDLVIVARSSAAAASVADFREWLRRAAARMAMETP